MIFQAVHIFISLSLFVDEAWNLILCGQTCGALNNSMLSLQSTASWNREYYVCKFKSLNVFQNMNTVFSKCLFPSSKGKLVHTKEWQFCTIERLIIKWTLNNLKTNLGSRRFPSPLQVPLFSYLSCIPVPPPLKVINTSPNLCLPLIFFLNQSVQFSRSVVSDSLWSHGL